MVVACVATGAVTAGDEPSKLERDAKAVGHEVGAAARKVGQEAKKVGKTVGHAARDGAKAAKEGGKEFVRAVKGEDSSQDKKPK
jgi:hypothetical protein